MAPSIEATFGVPVLQGAGKRWAENGGGEKLMSIMRGGGNAKSFNVFVLFSIAMFAVPAVVMFVARTFVVDRLNIAPGNRIVAAGIAAICSVQVVIVSFLVYALREPIDETPAPTGSSRRGASPGRKRE